MKRLTIQKEYTEYYETDECLTQLTVNNQFGSIDYDEESEIVPEGTSRTMFGESAPFPIDDLIKLLQQKSKSSGRPTHVEIVYHEDHDNYIFNFLKYNKIDNETLEEKRIKYLERQVEYMKITLKHEEKMLKEKQEKISKLQNELKEAKK